MRNLSGYLKKTLLLSSIFVFLLQLPSTAYATGVESALVANYRITDAGDLNANLTFTLTNNEIIPTVVNYYTVTIPFTSLDDLKVVHNGNLINRTIHKQTVGSDVVINFNNLVIPRGSSTSFSLDFAKSDYIQDDVASISLPAEFTGVDNVTVNATFPSDLPAPSWVSSKSYSYEKVGEEHKLSIKAEGLKSINILLGESVSYDFEITKQLVNTDDRSMVFDISVPAWTSNQYVTFEKVVPQPNSVVKDIEGNLTLKYLLSPGETTLVKVVGHISLPSERKEELIYSELGYTLENIEYWKLDGDTEYKRVALFLQSKGLNVQPTVGAFSDIKELEERKKFITEVYNYVMERLSNESLLTSSMESPMRAGASVAITKRTSAVPEDYSDLLISILRYYGVPSRMIVGYVSESSGYRSSGFFHSWVEYWDIDEKEWKTLDPSLDDLLDGSLLDMDLRERIAFLIRSRSSILPKLTYFSVDEFRFSPSSSSIDPLSKSKADFTVVDSDISKKYVSGDLHITNTGNTAFYISDIKFINDSKSLNYFSIFNYENLVALPGMTITIPMTIEGIENLTDLQQDVSIEYRVTTPNSTPTTELFSLSISFEKKWWWDWMVRLISFILFLALGSFAYFIYQRILKLWR